MKTKEIGVLIAVCAVLALTEDLVWGQSPVVFNDPALEAQVRLVLNKPSGDIYASDMETLQQFGASGLGISDLTGLEYAVNLEGLYLSENEIASLAPLAPLVKLLET